MPGDYSPGPVRQRSVLPVRPQGQHPFPVRAASHHHRMTTMSRRSLFLVPCSLALIAAPITAAEPSAPAPAPTAPADQVTPVEQVAIVVPSNWTNSGRLGLFLNNTVTKNGNESKDPTVSGATRSTAYLATAEGSAEWKENKHSVQNILKAKYGRTKTGDADWTETEDEIRYDGVYRYAFSAPHFGYGSWGAETVFTGLHDEDLTLPADDWSNKFDPILFKAAIGYGQLYENLWIPEKDRLEARLGARAQKRTGDFLSNEEKKVQTGIEAFLRYERTASAELKYFAQYEGFSEFNDLKHITNLVTAGMTIDFATIGKALGGTKLTVELGLRAYYETKPKEFEDQSVPGYNVWSLKQDTLVGATYAF